MPLVVEAASGVPTSSMANRLNRTGRWSTMGSRNAGIQQRLSSGRRQGDGWMGKYRGSRLVLRCKWELECGCKRDQC